MNNRACYVGSSRGRQSVKVFTPDFEHLYKSVKRSSEHLTGHDLIAARQEYLNDISPKQEIENVPKNEEIQQETKAARQKCITDIYPKKVIESVPKKEETQQETKAARQKCINDIYPKKVIENVPKKEETQQEMKMEHKQEREIEIEQQQEFGMSM